jgi:hypothetical protein
MLERGDAIISFVSGLILGVVCKVELLYNAPFDERGAWWEVQLDKTNQF